MIQIKIVLNQAMLQPCPQQTTVDTKLVLPVFWGHIGFNLEWDLVSVTKSSTALVSHHVKQDISYIIVTHEWYEA